MRFLFCLALFALALPASAQLSGTYGIPSDFATLQDAADALVDQGTSGPVTLLFAPGAYAGATAGLHPDDDPIAHPITLASATGDPADVVIQSTLPAAFALGRPFPNPATAEVRVPYDVPEAGPLKVAVWDLLGRRVAVLADGATEAGSFEATVPTGALAPGVYVVRMTAGAFSAVQRLTVVR